MRMPLPTISINLLQPSLSDLEIYEKNDITV